MNLEDINKGLVELAAQADELEYHELSKRLVGLSQSYYSPDDKLKDAKRYDEHKCLHAALIELKEDGPYLNGARIDGITGMNIEAKAGDFTKVDIKLVAKVHGLDDIKQEYSF